MCRGGEQISNDVVDLECHNKRAIKCLYDAFNSTDVDVVHLLLAPYLEWWFHGPPTHQHLHPLLTGAPPPCDTSFKFVPLSIVVFGSMVVAEGYDEGDHSVSWVHAWTMTDGIVTQVREYCNTSVTVTRLSSSEITSPESSCQSVWETSYNALVLSETQIRNWKAASALTCLSDHAFRRHSSNSPNQTVYIKNLNEKFRKEELKRSLYCLFSQYGKILDVVAFKTPKLRGQAWVAFLEVTSASNAVRQMQNFPFYDKPMRLHYAKTKSDCIAKEEGSFVPRDKKRKQEERAADRKRRTEEGPQWVPADGGATENGGRTQTSYRNGHSKENETAAPNNILFIENLPYEATSELLEVLFKQYPGFREVRMIDAKQGIAFVEFQDDVQSSMAMQSLQGFKVTPQNPISTSFAKK